MSVEGWGCELGAVAGRLGRVRKREAAPAKISENCYGTFPFLCYIPALSKGEIGRASCRERV